VQATSMADALEALSSMEKGRLFASAGGLETALPTISHIAGELGIKPLVIGGLAVSHRLPAADR
jgi:predicted dinucleotide-binding enzyme